MPAAPRLDLLLTIALGLFISVCNTSHAADFVPHNEGVGIKLGLTASDVRGQASPWVDNSQVTIGAGPSDPLLGITGGLFWSYALAPKFSIQTELQFTQGGANGGLYSGTTPLPDGTVRLNYIELAVLPKVHFRERDRQRFSAYAGLTLDSHCYDKVTPNGGTATQNTLYGLGIGAMWDYDSDRLTTLVDLRYTTSFNELQPTWPESSIRNQALTLSVGVSPGSRRARGQLAIEHDALDWKLAHLPNPRIRVDLDDGRQIKGLFVRYEPDTLTLSHLRRIQHQPDTLTVSHQRPTHRHSKREAKPDSVSVASMDEREVGIAIEGINRLFVHKGNAGKGLLIGAAIGAAFGALSWAGSQDEDDVVLLVYGFVIGTVVGGVIGGIDHWVVVYP
jgi:hypothetical protein